MRVAALGRIRRAPRAGEALPKHFQRTTLEIFTSTGDVLGPAQRERRRPPRKMTAEMELRLMGMVLDDPEATLLDHSARIMLSTGVNVSVSTICRAMRRIGMSYKRVRSSVRESLCSLLRL